MILNFFIIFSVLATFASANNNFKRVNQNMARNLQSVVSSSSSNVYRYEAIHLLEEPPIGTLIIDLASKLGISLDTSDYKFRFYSPQSVISNFFLIDQLTGHVKTQRTIDREYLCETKICGQCLTSNCTLTLEIVATLPLMSNKNNNISSKNDNLPKQKFVSFDVIIEDKNEFSPQFTQPILILNVSEAAPLNFQIPIEGAIDRDSQVTQISYSIAPVFPKSSEVNSINGDDTYIDNERYVAELKKLNSKIKLQTIQFSNQLNLIIVEPFDYENEKEYSFKILATDNGWPPLTGTCIVKLNIMDVNDNLPVFERHEYEYRTDEGVTPGTKLVRVHATDKDDGVNALIKYSFAEQAISSKISSSLLSQTASGLVDMTTKLFHIDENTGWISSNTYLDYEYQPIYRLVVKAQDQGANSMPVYATATIYLNDLNDNAPVINVTVPDEFHKYENNHLYISEWTQPGTFLAQIIVSDPDSGLNGKVDIELQEELKSEKELVESTTFYIEHLFNNFYSLMLKQSVDRENKSEYNIYIKAHDYGKPMLNTIKKVKVIIMDENDNQPRFIYSDPNEKMYKFSIAENSLNTSSHELSYLGTISCFDGDLEENGRISYRLVTVNASEDAIFKINESSGELMTFQSKIDREISNSYEFKVVCEDNSEKKRLSSISTIKVSVLDINDNKPLFEQRRYVFSVAETFGLYTKFAQMNAVDLDEPFTLNSKINYKIVNTASNTNLSKINEVFGINKENGELYLIKALDYEKDKYYEFYVVAFDFGVPMQADKVFVRINVVDVNDNAPEVLWPVDADIPLIFNFNELYENYANSINFEMFRINATDRDSNENGILKYTIEKQQKLNFLNEDLNQFRTNVHLFECDNQSGSINGLFLKRFSKSPTMTSLKSKPQIETTKSVERLFDDLIGVYYLEVKIQDSASQNSLHTNTKIFLTLNTNTTPINDDIKLLQDFLRQPSKSTNDRNLNGEQTLLSLKKYVHGILNFKVKSNDKDLTEFNDDNGDEASEEDDKFQFLNTIFRFQNSKNKHVELLFGANYRFILLIISIVVIIFLFITISVSVIVCYRRQKTLLSRRIKKKVNDSKIPVITTDTKININDNMLSSLIDVTSQSSAEDNNGKKSPNLNTALPTGFQQENNLQINSETMKRFNKLRAADYDLNISGEDQTALLLCSNSPSSSSSSTTSNRQVQNSSNASATSNQTIQTQVSRKPSNLTSSTEHEMDETCRPKYNTLRTFKNVPVVGTPIKRLDNSNEKNKNEIYNEPLNIYERSNAPQMSTFSSENYQNKYYTLPINKLSVTGNLVSNADENIDGTIRSKLISKVPLKKETNNENENELYSKTLNNRIEKLENKEYDNNKDIAITSNLEFDILNRNKFQKNSKHTNKCNNEIPNYFFKNKKELKKLACKNNIIDCKRLELPNDETN